MFLLYVELLDITPYHCDSHFMQPAGAPEWLKDQLEATAAAWPQDDFAGVQRPPATPDGPPEWRIKCYDCPGMVR